MTVTEAMWKGKAVIGGNAAGVRLQIKSGENGFVISSHEEMAEKIVELINNPEAAKQMGERARLSVKKNFLMPRLLKDYLELFNKTTINYPKKKAGDESVTAIFSFY